MNKASIPTPLKKALEKMSTLSEQHNVCIESGDYALEASLYRAATLAKEQKKNSISSPTLMYLVDQDLLEIIKSNSDYSTLFSGIYLSEENTPKENLSALQKQSRVLITTPIRAIDHLRRGNIDLLNTNEVLVLHSFVQGENESIEQLDVRKQLFFDDCRFIFTKVGKSTNIEYYCHSLSDLQRDSKDLCDDISIISLSSWYRSRYSITNIISSSLSVKVIEDILYTLSGDFFYVVLGQAVPKKALNTRLFKAKLSLPHKVITSDDIVQLQEDAGNTAITVVPIGVTVLELTNLIKQLFTWERETHRIVTILKASEAQKITTSKETLLMDTETKLSPTQEDVTAGKLQLLAAKVKVDSQPEELEALKKAFRKNVSFTQRANVTAFLLREYLQLNATKKSSSTSPDRKKAPITKKPVTPKPAKAPVKAREIPEGSRTIYINIGKMRRLYAKELSQVLIDKLEISKESIYSIRVHDKYSFVTLDADTAEKAIEVLNGIEIRGRVAAVSYSNKE
jgi:hypothetical protein